MPSVNLSEKEWNVVLAVLATGPWNQVNDLLMKIGDQLRQQAQASNPPNIAHRTDGIGPRPS
jgi:hypothetical protein